MDRPNRRSDSRLTRRTTPGDLSPRPDAADSTVYRVRVSGHLDDRWANWRDGLSIEREEGGDTVLTVRAVDQAALLGLLRTLRDVGARLVSINSARPKSKGSSREGQS